MFESELNELAEAAKQFPDYRPTVKTDDDIGECGPRIVPAGNDYARLHRLTEKFIPKLESAGIEIPEGEQANPAGRLVYWALPDKRELLSEHRPADKVFWSLPMPCKK